MKISYLKMFVIWFTLSIAMTYILFSTVILPGINVPGIPFVIVITLLVHLSMFFWIMWTYIESPDAAKSSAQTYEKLQKENQVPWVVYGLYENKL